MNNRLIFNSYTILIVDDDIYINEMIQLYLKNRQFQILSAHSGKEALDLFHSHSVHLAILDIMLPELDGWEVCKQIRESSTVPVLFLTAKGESSDKIKGLNLGADDYLIKPFDPNELVARVMSLLRRAYLLPQPLPTEKTITFGPLKIDTLSRTITIFNEFIDVTQREFQLMLILGQHPNQVLDRQQLLDLVWGEDYEGEERVVDVFITRLRHKLDFEELDCKIETVRGFGYKFKVANR